MSRILKPVFAVVVMVALVLAVDSEKSRAALDTETAAIATSGLEILVVEVEGCIYCMLFRRDVATDYQRSERARTIPMRFADLNAVDAATAKHGLTLKEPVQNVPTAILLKKGVEVGRVPGYSGPENFFHAINYLILGAR